MMLCGARWLRTPNKTRIGGMGELFRDARPSLLSLMLRAVIEPLLPPERPKPQGAWPPAQAEATKIIRFFDTPVSPAPDASPISAQLSRADPGEHGGGEEQWASIRSLPATSWMMPLRRRRFVR